jgi:hypothetical protein
VNDLVAFVDKNGGLSDLRPDGFGLTVREYHDSKGGRVSLATCLRTLDGLVVSGLLERREMLANGRKTNVYARPEEWQKMV